MKLLPIFLLGAVVTLGACGKEDPAVPGPPATLDARLTLRIEPWWGSVPFNKQNIYEDGVGHRVLVQMLKFYLAELRLSGADGDVTLSPIELVNITNGPIELEFPIAEKSFEQLSFGIGVPYDLNRTDPVLYPNEHPLSVNQGMYWTWASMYRFIIFEGRFDNDLGASGIPPFQFSLHTGLDSCYRELTLPAPLELVAGEGTTLRLKVDLQALFSDGTSTLDLSLTSQAHGSPEELPVALLLSDLMRSSISMVPQ